MIDIALKEWSTVCDLLAAGRTALLLRKGGIHEDAGPGRFRLEHDRFALFPAWEHERPDWIKPDYRLRDEPLGEEPAEVVIKGYAEVAGLWPAPSRGAFDRLDGLHVWLPPQIDMRFDYKPDRPVFVMAVRVYRLPVPHVMPNRPAFAGCRSWVPLDGNDTINPAGATPAMDDAAFADVVKRIERAFAS